MDVFLVVCAEWYSRIGSSVAHSAEYRRKLEQDRGAMKPSRHAGMVMRPRGLPTWRIVLERQLKAPEEVKNLAAEGRLRAETVMALLREKVI